MFSAPAQCKRACCARAQKAACEQKQLRARAAGHGKRRICDAVCDCDLAGRRILAERDRHAAAGHQKRLAADDCGAAVRDGPAAAVQLIDIVAFADLKPVEPDNAVCRNGRAAAVFDRGRRQRSAAWVFLRVNSEGVGALDLADRAARGVLELLGYPELSAVSVEPVVDGEQYA